MEIISFLSKETSGIGSDLNFREFPKVNFQSFGDEFLNDPIPPPPQGDRREDIKDRVKVRVKVSATMVVVVGGEGNYIIFVDFNTVREESEKWGYLLEKLKVIDHLIDLGIATSSDIEDRNQLKSKIYDIYKKEMADMAQKTKIKWSIEGDENSKYYHGILNKKRYSLSIKGIKHEGMWITEASQVSSPMVVNDFRPISLIRIQYKIIAKLLARVVDTVVSVEQTTFIKGRQILDGPLLVNELVDWYKKKKKKKKMMILKIDFEKAFDSISWDYLDNMLEFMNFPTRWRRWIFACLYSARSPVLINGSPTQEFMLHRCLRQGDCNTPQVRRFEKSTIR
ncbi:RNA-directed DNA polymerase, eukaryota, reverse transcriptase zinc-binding domain protein [Tanacetum coccineum]